MRDNLKDVVYFNEFIEEDMARINKFSDKLRSGEVREDRLFAVKQKVHDLKLGILVARYSRGDEICLLEEEYIKLVEEWEEVWEPEYYNKNLKMISLAVLFDVDKVLIERIKGMLEKSDIRDWLLEYLVNAAECEQINSSPQMLFPKAFLSLQKAVFEKNKIESLKKYLSHEWYNEDCGCYEAHKSKQNIYYGYWSFESGAIAKILNIEDSSLKDVPYYPYDLVHYKDNGY